MIEAIRRLLHVENTYYAVELHKDVEVRLGFVMQILFIRYF